MATIAHRDLQWLVSRAGDAVGSRSLLAALARVDELLNNGCVDALVWAVAYGPILERVEAGTARRLSPSNIKVMVVTTQESFFEATLSLGEKVFGPVLTEFDAFIEFDVLK